MSSPEQISSLLVSKRIICTGEKLCYMNGGIIHKVDYDLALAPQDSSMAFSQEDLTKAAKGGSCSLSQLLSKPNIDGFRASSPGPISEGQASQRKEPPPSVDSAWNDFPQYLQAGEAQRLTHQSQGYPRASLEWRNFCCSQLSTSKTLRL